MRYNIVMYPLAYQSLRMNWSAIESPKYRVFHKISDIAKKGVNLISENVLIGARSIQERIILLNSFLNLILMRLINESALYSCAL